MTRIKNIMTAFLIILLYQLPANAQWIQSSVINQGFVSSVAVKDSIIFLGGINLSDSAYSYFYSKDYGDTWTECFNPLAYNPNAIVITDNYIFTGEGIEGGYLFRTADWGLTWEDCSPINNGYTALAYCDGSLYAGTATDACPGGVWKTTDEGDTWEEVWLGVSCVNLSIIAFDSLVFDAVGSAQIFSSFDYGKTWKPMNIELPEHHGITRLILFNNMIFAGTGFNGTDDCKTYYSTNLGESWLPVSDGLDGSHIMGFAANHNYLFVTTLYKIYILQEQTMTWQDITGDFTMEYIQGLAVYGDQLICYGTTGLWYRPISEITGIEQGPDTPREYGLGQNYPNPFNPATKIEYTLPTAGNVVIKVYDVLGQEIAVLVNGFKTAGRHRISFNGSQLPSGIYLYSISSGPYRQVKKMLLVK